MVGLLTSERRYTASWLASQPESERRTFLDNLTDAESSALFYDWQFWARDNQLTPPGNWYAWLILAGRGYGKTRIGAEWICEQAKVGEVRLALIGQTAADVRDTMVEGESGILAISPPDFKPHYEPSKRRLTWPNAARATTYSGDEPDQLRGPQHHKAWADEPAKWKYLDDAWANMELGLRLGEWPQVVATTTPRPIKLIKDLIKDPQCHVTRGSTYENFGNLAPAFIERVIKRYEGTRLGRQELRGEILDDNPRALWQRNQIEELRIRREDLPGLMRIVVGVDPMVADPNETPELEESGSSTGIIVAGVVEGEDGHGYVLEDRTVFGTPNQWGRAVVEAYTRWQADRVIGETNQGGAMVNFVIATVARDMGVRIAYKAVHASRGKYIRAEPIAALYEQNRVHHVGCFPELEDELCEWEPGMPSPNRLDANVWALTELMVTGVKRVGTAA